MRQTYPILTQWAEPTGCWVATSPGLPVNIEGRGQTAAAAVEAFEAAIDRAAAEGQDLPSPTPEVFATAVGWQVMSLRELRQLTGLSQKKFAVEFQIGRTTLVRAEKAGDHKIGFIRRLVESTGDKLEIFASGANGESVRLNF